MIFKDFCNEPRRELFSVLTKLEMQEALSQRNLRTRVLHERRVSNQAAAELDYNSKHICRAQAAMRKQHERLEKKKLENKENSYFEQENRLSRPEKKLLRPKSEKLPKRVSSAYTPDVSKQTDNINIHGGGRWLMTPNCDGTPATSSSNARAVSPARSVSPWERQSSRVLKRPRAVSASNLVSPAHEMPKPRALTPVPCVRTIHTHTPAQGLPLKIELTPPSRAVTPTSSLTPVRTVTPTRALTPTRAVTPTDALPSSRAVTPTNSLTPLRTVTPTRALTPTRAVTPTGALTPSRAVSPTNSLTPVRTVTPTRALTPTRAVTPTDALTPSRAVTPTNSLTPIRTITPTRVLTPTRAVSPTNLLTPVRVVTPTRAQTPTFDVIPAISLSPPSDAPSTYAFTLTPAATTCELTQSNEITTDALTQTQAETQTHGGTQKREVGRELTPKPDARSVSPNSRIIEEDPEDPPVSIDSDDRTTKRDKSPRGSPRRGSDKSQESVILTSSDIRRGSVSLSLHPTVKCFQTIRRSSLQSNYFQLPKIQVDMFEDEADDNQSKLNLLYSKAIETIQKADESILNDKDDEQTEEGTSPDIDTLKELQGAISKEKMYTKSNDPKGPHRGLDAAQKNKILRLISVLKKLDPNFGSCFRLDPVKTLDCGYLRLSQWNVETLETMIRKQGKDPGIHKYMDVTDYDIFADLNGEHKEKER